MSGKNPATPAATVFPTTDVPQVEGASGFGISASGGVQTVITPAANVNGIIIRTLQAQSSAGNSNTVFADTAAPATYNDSTKRIIFMASDGSINNLAKAIKIPPGCGLFVACNSASGAFYGTYDIL